MVLGLGREAVEGQGLGEALQSSSRRKKRPGGRLETAGRGKVCGTVGSWGWGGAGERSLTEKQLVKMVSEVWGGRAQRGPRD